MAIPMDAMVTMTSIATVPQSAPARSQRSQRGRGGRTVDVAVRVVTLGNTSVSSASRAPDPATDCCREKRFWPVVGMPRLVDGRLAGVDRAGRPEPAGFRGLRGPEAGGLSFTLASLGGRFSHGRTTRLRTENRASLPR